MSHISTGLMRFWYSIQKGELLKEWSVGSVSELATIDIRLVRFVWCIGHIIKGLRNLFFQHNKKKIVISSSNAPLNVQIIVICRLLRRWNGQTGTMNRKFIISLFKKFDKDVIHSLLFDHQVKKSPFLDIIFSLLFQCFFGCIWLLLNPRKKRLIEISKGKKMNQHVVKMIKNCILLLLVQCLEGVPFAVPRYLFINPKIIVA